MQKGLRIRPLQLISSVDDSEHFQEGYTAYIIHHPSPGHGPVSMARSLNACDIICFKGGLSHMFSRTSLHVHGTSVYI